MMDVHRAREALLATERPALTTETITLEQAFGRTLASDIQSTANVPPADNSAMDGYALSDSEHATGATITISQTIAAGSPPQPLQPGTCARVLTGAEIPAGANAVVIQENVSRTDDRITLHSEVTAGDNIRPAGQDIAAGEVIARAGDKLSAATLGVLASAGIAQVPVFEKLKVALLNTGQELVNPGQPLNAGEIYNSNRYALGALIEALGCDLVSTSTLPDNLDATRQALKTQASNCDLILTSGGVSVGDEDHVKAAIEAEGALQMWKIQIKPGKPLAYGHIKNEGRKTPVLGLPGNPVSAFITFLMFAIPLLRTLQGQNYFPPAPWQVPAAFSVDKPRKRPEYARAQRTPSGAELYPNQSSGVLRSVQWADGLVLIPAGEAIRKGQPVDYYPLNDFFI